jgi:polysaccharide export outer membrane protein
MKQLASLWSFVFFALAASQLMANCGMDAAQTNKPVVTASAGSNPAATVSPVAQPVVGGGVTDRASGATAMAVTTDAQAGQRVGSGQPIAASGFGDADATDYRISRQDILQIQVFQVNDLNSAVQVGQDGNIALPLVGRVEVAGRTTPEAEQIIADKLRQKYLQSPQVSVQVKAYGKRITVSGATGARVLPDDGNTTLSQAIASSGGVAEIGNAGRIHVARVKDQHVQDNIYDLDDIQAGKAPDPLLHGGDIVVVEQSGVKVALKDLYALFPLAIFAPLF